MNSLDHAASTALLCCRRPMSSIEVTSPVEVGSTTLALHTCSACGRHVWQRDGQELERSAVLDALRDRIAEGPAARAPRQRKPRAR